MASGGRRGGRGKNTVTLRHYTDEAGARAIQETGRIKMANEHDVYGPGTYMTKMSQQSGHSKEDIAWNNYKSGAQKNLDRGRVDKCIEVQVPKGIVERCPDQNRDVWRVPNQDLNLNKCKGYKVKDVY